MPPSPTSEDLEGLLAQRFGSLAGSGGCDVAACAVVGDVTGYWTSGPELTATFEIGSVTKTFTALLLAEMASEGLLDLDDRLGDYLPAASESDIRLLDLVTHTSGLPRLPRRLLARALLHPSNPYATFSERQVQRALSIHARRAAPRSSGFAYSNFGFGILGLALAAADGRPFHESLRSRIVEPLGLKSVTFDFEDGPDRLAGHNDRGKVVANWSNPVLAGCGCLWSDIEDIQSYIRANLAPEKTPLESALRLVGEPRREADQGRRMGLGWLINNTAQGPLQWQNGGTGGFGAFAGFIPNQCVGIGVLVSRAHPPALDTVAIRLITSLAKKVAG